MSIAWPEAVDTEADWDDVGELYDDSEPESEDYEATRSGDWRQQARLRRVALARRRQASRFPQNVAVRPNPAAAAIRTLDLQSQVTKDAFRSSAAAQNRRMSRAEYSAVLSATVDQFIESFQAPANPYFRAALRYSPLLLLSPQRRGRGLEALVTDPRFVGAAAVTGITLVGETRRQSSVARSLEITGPTELAIDDSDQFLADVLDSKGRLLNLQPTWTSSNPSVASIDADGNVTGNDVGKVTITATVDDVMRRVRLSVIVPVI